MRGQYFWHRFFSHQPDLNYDNPDVREAMLNVLRFWLDLGIDGFRLDAVPYLYERDGTNGENLRWLDTENERLLAYLKDDVIVVVNLDFAEPQAGLCVVAASLGLPPAFGVRDLLGGDAYHWTIGRNYVRLEPGKSHVFKVELGA